jgi:hypothetical protein
MAPAPTPTPSSCGTHNASTAVLFGQGRVSSWNLPRLILGSITVSSTAKIFEEDVAEHSAASIYIDGLGDASAVALVVPEVSPQDGAAVIGADALDFMTLLREQESDQVSIGVCGETENIHYSQLNSIILDIGSYLLTNVGVPLFVSVLGSYIESKISQHNSEEIELRVSIIKGRGKSKKKYFVSGKPKDVLRVIKGLEKNESC